MNKELTPLKALERIKEFYPQWRLSNRNDFEIIETEIKEKEKQDEILRIIKEKKVQTNRLNRSHSAKQYNLYLPKEMHLTQKEYDLLKEYYK